MSEKADLPEDGGRPVVRTAPPSNYGLYAFIAILLVGGVWLFTALNAARETASAPTTFATDNGAGQITSPQPLSLPERARVLPVDIGEVEGAPPPMPAPTQQTFYSPPVAPPQPSPPPVFNDPPRSPFADQPPIPSVIFDRAQQTGSAEPQALQRDDANRVLASRLRNPSFTVTQGTIIPAVLETAFDSTRPGRVRALVQRDVHSFDGTRVLVPRGSRLFGEYDAGISPGERRALITWTRLLRPDGVSIALDSPASDPLGRGGVEGDVNSRFWARFGGALLQTVLDIGVGVAVGSASDGGTILALPGSTQNVVQGGNSQQPRPVLEIDHGTSVSVHVARDLDFSTVES
ncbi:TrbI/VirB10 family protein [Aurantiacibacter marinus]|uniref:Conjugal transfer protein TrbI n=1 Tax=Aurantiacibacter marinus TaxID=874156 RepID=A0A0H0XRD9_9SPHN|nr:TrbI/VirB10 family protein [Aurantiacibacter marinus]KLI62815.1 hypothetical protein AAV99_12030 [Aurantiacibacter marinus]